MSNQNITRMLYANLSKLVASGRLKNKRIVLFGVNAYAYKTCVYLTSRCVKVHAVVDSYKHADGNTFCGMQVQSPEAALGNFQDDVVVLVASQYFKEMAAQLEPFGYRERHVVSTIPPPAFGVSWSHGIRASLTYMMGRRLHRRFRRTHGADSMFFLLPYAAIGDAYVLGSYVRSFLDQCGCGKAVFAVVGRACGRAMAMFGHSPIVELTQKQMDALIVVGRMQGFEAAQMLCLNHRLVHTDLLDRFEIYGRMRWGYMVRRILFDLPEATEPEPPMLSVDAEAVDSFFRRHGLKPGRTAVLSPYANTLMGLDAAFWDMLVGTLISEGFNVCTNSGHPEKEPPLKNTAAVFFPIEQASAMVEKAGVFIGLRSGICDVLGLAKATKVVLYPDEKSLFFSLIDCGFSSGLTEIVCNLPPEQLCDKVMGAISDVPKE